ncbi:outer membrane lipoprotein carrier protein LolA [Mesobacillus foraminis]|jgi:outer membrane lipoprotein-sorting protein|uniref:Outer membrane lipoprotein-sorting protein n=1 Tax=Mesobacillus foraminis TaxID=279826 RepID=A0A4R2AW18_9BACI|nr:outer membrane lipoprotein carrier protein LolA [Mesobacillus foraminis]MBT2759603.1 outer membrane lipoprotein carrier protein LolA [Mesobacillus foraminis]TCN18006.1 outer membrane lipoprotein-sorting protein [Mesobacillus foraminis]
MKKRFMLLLAGLMVMFALAACGAKSQESVVKDLDEALTDLKSYKANAKMTLQMGSDPQVYEVEIWHKDPDYYRVNLKNAQKDQSQMILRNDDGVFVLTPALNKSFRFQSSWPQNSSQAYLYESLVQDILEDKEAKFSETKQHYVFETKTRYQNSQMLPLQEIKLNKKDLAPVSVKVMDSDRNALVTVEFSDVKIGADFDKDAFDMKKNMTASQLEVPVMAAGSDKEFTVKYPVADLPGVTLKDEKVMETANGKRIVLTYGGEKSYTLVQEKAGVMDDGASPVSVNGNIVDLGFTIGAQSENSIRWTHQGVEYMLASSNLSPEEMVMVAKSVQGDVEK